jgi:hypothetical protein
MILRATLNVQKHTEISSINPFNSVCVSITIRRLSFGVTSVPYLTENVRVFLNSTFSAMIMKCAENVLLNSTSSRRWLWIVQRTCDWIRRSLCDDYEMCGEHVIEFNVLSEMTMNCTKNVWLNSTFSAMIMKCTENVLLNSTLSRRWILIVRRTCYWNGRSPVDDYEVYGERVIEFNVLSAMTVKCTENVWLNSTFSRRWLWIVRRTCDWIRRSSDDYEVYGERVIEFNVLSEMTVKCTENVWLNSTFSRRWLWIVRRTCDWIRRSSNDYEVYGERVIEFDALPAMTMKCIENVSLNSTFSRRWLWSVRRTCYWIRHFVGDDYKVYGLLGCNAI